MVRVFAASGRAERFTVTSPRRPHVYLSDPRESRGREVAGPIDLRAYGVVTLRLEGE